MQFPIAVGFSERHTGFGVPGVIRPVVEEDLLAWTTWRYGARDEDKEWDWRGIYLDCKRRADRYECYAAVAASQLHGLMLLDLKGRKIAGSRSLIVDYLSTNPTDRTASHGLKYIGTALIGVAVMRSIDAGMDGRIWLESLPRAASFYENLGFVGQLRRSREGNLVYVLHSNLAKALLEEVAEKRIIIA